MATSIFRINFPQAESLQKAVSESDYIIGLDLHKKTTAICVIDPRQPEKIFFQRKRLQNIQVLERIKNLPGKKFVVAEAAYGWFPLREALTPIKNVTFAILDPRKSSAWVETSGIKNDKIDAQILAHICVRGAVSQLAVHQPSSEETERFKLSNLRNQLVHQQTRIKNQLKALDRNYGTNPYTGEVSEKSKLIKDMEDLLLDQLAFHHKKIQALEKKMETISKEDPIVGLLTSIPGIGSITAFALRWKIGTIDRFVNKEHLSSYFGFGIRQHQSGDHFIKGKLTKTGNSLIRRLLVQGAQVIRFKRPDLLELYLPKLAQKNVMKNSYHANKVVGALARKNLTFIFKVWKTRTPFDLNIYRERRQQSQDTFVSSSKAAELDPALVLKGR